LLDGANKRGLVFIPWARRNHQMVVAQLAQKVTPGRQMASNPASPFRIEFTDVDDLHAKAPESKAGAKGNANGVPFFAAPANAGLAAEQGLGIAPLAALAARQGRPLRVAILSDFTRISYANGAVFQTRFLYQELRRCGHEVTVIGPHDPDAAPDELAPGTVSIPSVPLRAYPGVHVPLPLARWVFDTSRWNFDICFAQTTSMLLEFGVWLREMMGVPLLCVNTTHLVAAYDVLLPEKLSKNNMFQAGVHLALKRPFERIFANIYNQSDGLVVLSEGLRTYWRERGVTVPIHVIPRAVQPDVFDRPIGLDPYTHLIEREKLPQRGARLVCAGRHTREKSPDRVIRIFAEHVLPLEPDATLTLVGEGPETDYCRRLAQELGAEHHVFFTSEVPWMSMPDYYRYADIFVHASLSETYGNVLGEALWCGTPTVAFADGMGTSAQITDGQNGVLFAPGNGALAVAAANAAFGRAVVELIRDPKARARLSKAAGRRARERSSPLAVQQRIADAFENAQDHAVASGLRPAVERPRMMRWLSTIRHAQPWTTFNGLIYLSGRLRPARVVTRRRIHPGLGD
jgi:glycosyltransferase involved in cell wall biosynthesis